MITTITDPVNAQRMISAAETVNNLFIDESNNDIHDLDDVVLTADRFNTEAEDEYTVVVASIGNKALGGFGGHLNTGRNLGEEFPDGAILTLITRKSGSRVSIRISEHRDREDKRDRLSAEASVWDEQYKSPSILDRIVIHAAGDTRQEDDILAEALDSSSSLVSQPKVLAGLAEFVAQMTAHVA